MIMAIKKVWLDESNDSCIACGICESLCPDVFEIKYKMEVKADADFAEHEKEINEAIIGCPTGVINKEEE